MRAEERRIGIREVLSAASHPISASALASRFSVSRQVIVGDIALLRASGADISATPRGYIVSQAPSGLIRRVACRHGISSMRKELYAIVDEGCTVIDVIVEHPIYGQLTGALQISSRHEVNLFMERCAHSDAQPLSVLTEGLHLHTLSCPDEAAFLRVKAGLEALGLLLKQ